MQQFVDRAEELASLEGLLAQARHSATPVVVSIEGVSGIGKTALLDAFLSREQERVRVARLRAQRLERLSTGSLEDVLRSGAHIIALDDAQWCNHSTKKAIDTALAERRIYMLVLVHDGSPLVARVAVDHRIVLQPLSNDAIERVACLRAPGLSSAQMRAIVKNANGLPYEAERLAQLDPGALSAASAIAHFIARLPANARTIAQSIALIAAPVDMNFLRTLWSDSRELKSALELLSPLIERNGDTVEFDHALTGAAVVETIPMKIPLHRRIAAALERNGVTSLRNRMLLLEQLLAGSDRETARETALDLAFEATQLHALSAQLWASARHVELGEPPDARFVAFYAHYLDALTQAGQHDQVEAIASHALSEAQRRRLTGIAPLVAQLIRAQWAIGRREAAQASFNRYVESLTDPQDQALLRAAASWLRAS